MGCRCCGPCFTAQGNSQFEAPCCKCIPKKICVEVYPPAALSSYCECSEPPVDDPYGPMIRMTLTLDCTGQHNKYVGSFVCGTGVDSTIDLTFRFERDTDVGLCYFVLESEALGHVYAAPLDGYAPVDNRLKVTMGGDYGSDQDARRAECIAGGPFEFNIDLSSRRDGCGDARVIVNAADYMAKPDDDVNLGVGERACSCGCMLVFLTKDGVATEVKACYDSYAGGWAGLFDISPDEQYAFTIYHEGELGYAGGTSLRLASDLGDGESQSVHCSSCDMSMNTSWSLPGDIQIRAFCAKKGACLECSIPCDDCKCFCRCVCVIYNSELDAVATVVRACWDEYNYEWTADVGSRILHFRLACDETTGVTTIVLTDQDGATLGLDSNSGGEPKAANCPDISATWAITEYGNTTTTVSIVCDNCGNCSNLIQTPCCEVPVPLVIYATVSGVHSCWRTVMDPDPTLTTIPTITIPLAFDPNPSGMPFWRGTKEISGFLLDKRCNAGTPGTLGYITLTLKVLCGFEVESAEFICYGPDNSFLGSSTLILSPPSDGYNTCNPVHVTCKLGQPDPSSGYMNGGITIGYTLPCRPDGSGGDDRGYFFDVVVTE